MCFQARPSPQPQDQPQKSTAQGRGASPAQLHRLQTYQGSQLSQGGPVSFPGPQGRGWLGTRWTHLGWGAPRGRGSGAFHQVWPYQWPAATPDLAQGTTHSVPRWLSPHSPPCLSASFPCSLPSASCSALSHFKENSYKSQGDGQTLRPGLVHSHPYSYPGQGRVPPLGCASPIHS